MNASMVSDQITRMGKFDASYRSEYETALKNTSMTAVTGEISLMQTDGDRILLIVYIAGAFTVCTGSLEYELITHDTFRQVQH